ncbi:regulatory protein RecX [Thiohalorhabdus sp. Cl-TMA]|uniref:Regulatory protein RecX n=1 Tax=Thiohalorhabdus methylotrophus TaxID=3242694 RepID=A0ABV4TX62_9GAMM
MDEREGQFDEAVEAAYAQALKLLVRREHSRRELARKLVERDHPRPAADAALDRLEAEGAQSDQRFAEEYARARFAKGYGPRRVEAELREHGIGPEGMAHAALERGEERSLAAAQLAKRFGDAPPADARERAKRTRYLQQRGFDPEVCARLLRDAGNPEEEAGF